MKPAAKETRSIPKDKNVEKAIKNHFVEKNSASKRLFTPNRKNPLKISMPIEIEMCSMRLVRD